MCVIPFLDEPTEALKEFKIYSGQLSFLYTKVLQRNKPVLNTWILNFLNLKFKYLKFKYPL